MTRFGKTSRRYVGVAFGGEMDVDAAGVVAECGTQATSWCKIGLDLEQLVPLVVVREAEDGRDKFDLIPAAVC